jgi:hypothetical protein
MQKNRDLILNPTLIEAVPRNSRRGPEGEFRRRGMHMGTAVFWAAFLFHLLLAGGSKADGQALPSAQQLLLTAPHLSLQAKEINSFEATGRLDWEQVHLKFELFASRPDQTTLHVLDPKDQTPILWASGGAFMFYDPVADEVVIGRGFPFFLFRIEPVSQEVKEDGLGREQLNLGFGVSTQAATAASGLALDLKSFWTNLKEPPQVHPGEKGAWLLHGRTQKGGRIIAHISPARAAGPYKRFELFLSDAAKEPFCTLEEITINQPLKPGIFEFPQKFLLNSGLRIRKIEPTAEPGFLLDMAGLARAILARLAIHGGDEIKDLVEKMYFRKLDWGALAVSDRRASGILISMSKEGRSF